MNRIYTPECTRTRTRTAFSERGNSNWLLGLCLAMLLGFLPAQLQAQQAVQLLFENFDGTGAPLFITNQDSITTALGTNQWVYNNSYDGLGIYPDTTPQSDVETGTIGGAPTSTYLHITDSLSTATNCNFDSGVASDRTAVMADGICTMGLEEITLTFFYIGEGSEDAYGEVYYSADNGPWTKIGEDKYNQQSIWKYEELTDLAFEDVEDLRFGFRWVNNSGSTAPGMSWGLDEVQIVAVYDDVDDPITIDITAIDEAICEGSVLGFTFELSDTLCDGSYEIQLSNSVGNFDTPAATWGFNVFYPSTGNAFNLTMPTYVAPGPCYRIRINRLFPLPQIEGIMSDCFEIEDCENVITTMQPAVTLDPNGVCLGSVIDVPFTSTGAYNPGNTYFLQLSGPDGSFDSPEVELLGQISDFENYDPALGDMPGSVGGLVPFDIEPSCDYYVRISSSFPGTFGIEWGPFCIVECDITTNNQQDVVACCLEGEDNVLPIECDINVWDDLIAYSDENEFQVELLDPMFLSQVSIGEIGFTINNEDCTFDVIIPPTEDLWMYGLAPGMYYLRIVAVDPALDDVVLGTMVHLLIGCPLAEDLIIGQTDTVLCQDDIGALYVINSQMGSEYQWYLNGIEFPPGGGLYPSPGYISVLFNSEPGNVLQFNVQEYNFGCWGDISPPAFVEVIAPPIVEVSGPSPVCAGDVVQYEVPFIPATYYDWNISGGEIVDTGNNVVTVQFLEPGTQTVTLNALNTCGSGVGSLEVEVYNTPEVEVTPFVSVCTGETVTIEADISNGTAVWDDGYGNIETDVSSVTITPTGTVFYTLTVTDGICETVEYISVVVSDYPVAEITGDLVGCEGEGVTITAGGGSNITWNTGETTPSITVTESGDYWAIVYEGSASCTDSTGVTVALNPSPTVDLGEDQDLCEGANLTLDAGNTGASFTWSNGASGQTLDVTESGTYWVTVDDGVCSSSDTINVGILELPTVELVDEILLCEGDTTSIEVFTNASDISWSTGETSATLDIVATPGGQTYYVEVSDFCGAVTDSVRIVTEACGQPCIVVPNAFSPNYDGINDVFQPVLFCEVDNYYFKVFDRWGNKVYDTTDPASTWNGLYKDGKAANLGSYAWVVEFDRTELGQAVHETHHGNVTLLR